MKTENHSINDVLNKNSTSFYIPPFQRAYAWGKPEIERFFSDIVRIIDSELDNSQRDKLEHFFGTLVIKEETEGFASKSVVVDGQQRLTTTLLFLTALRDIENNEVNQNYITDNYLKNNSSTFQDKIKLKQVTKDWDAYRALVNKKQPSQGIIYNAYLLFSKLINEKKNQNQHLQLEHFILAIKRMNVAVIFLDERPFKGEDPQIIFETLNSLGKPLTLSDLIRNFVLLNMNSNSQSKTYEDIWYPKIEHILNDNASNFFRDYLQYKTVGPLKVVSDNNTKELYQKFKNFVDEHFKAHHSDFIKDITRYVSWYNWIITEVNNDAISADNNKNIEIKELLRNIFHDIKAEAFKPFVLGLLEYHQCGINDIKLNDEQLISILTTIRTYLIRRRILGLTQGENKNIVLLSSHIKELATGENSMFDYLSNMFYRLRFPNDDEIRKCLISINFYEGLKKYSKFILGKIEENNTKVSVDFRNDKITIEHIMPQKINDSWEKELGPNFSDIHKVYLHNIGNLILTEFNSEIGNKPFDEKKLKLNTSSLYFRLDIINLEFWDEDAINEHQEKMIDYFLNAFFLPESYKTKSNWSTSVTESTIFSPLDGDAADLAGSKPVELHIFNNVIKVRTWQDVFIKFIEQIKNSEKIDFDYVLQNQVELFNKNETIIKWPKLEELIDEKAELANRYKTLNGKICTDVINLTDGELFIHINISASTCISRISNIMNKFNISEKDVEINLK